MPICISILSFVSVYVIYVGIDIVSIKYTLIVGNLLMTVILVWSSLSYIQHFRRIHQEPHISQDMNSIRDELSQWDGYFRSFFNWSITNQWILISILLIEIGWVLLYGKRIGGNFWILVTDMLVIFIEIILLRAYRKRMMDLEMDYNIIVPGKIFFVNQSGLLSVIQTIDWDKIKTVQSVFPSKIASFFNYGSIHILTEGDSQQMMWTMSMFYVTSPDAVVSHIHTLIDDPVKIDKDIHQNNATHPLPKVEYPKNSSKRHTLDTREKIRDVMR